MKKIGIVGHPIQGGIGVGYAYMNKFLERGSVEILFPWMDIKEDLDLLVLPGGPDVDVSRYNAIPSVYTGKPCPYREYFDTKVLPKYIDNGTSIFGTCRGMQSLYVHFGGKLIQHMRHETNGDDREELVHKVKFIDGKLYPINSLHHQVVDPNNVPKHISPIAWHEWDDNIEAFIHDRLPIAGCQWHEEELEDDEISDTLINMLLNKEDLNSIWEKKLVEQE